MPGLGDSSNCLVSFGANLGDPRATIEQALEQLRTKTAATSFRSSRLYNTPPVGGPVGQPPFLNCVAALETTLSPWEVWQVVREIESGLGRERFKRWEARRIDVDILLYGDQRIWTPQLKIPHPRLCMRRFILEPAAEIAPDWIDPVSQQSMLSLAKRLRSGRANLVLCAAIEDRPVWLLEQVARQSVADWFEVQGNQGNFQINGPRQSRWVAPLAVNGACVLQDSVIIQPSPKLIVFYAADRAKDSGGQWEDTHRRLAQRLGMSPPSDASRASRDDSQRVSLCPSAARYLLVTDDPAWGVHELVAALDAMDCPVEPVIE